MIEYIYFVKCSNCEDEPFHFFSTAKDFAISRLSEKPIITQVEVKRNDFGECVDSCDLGTVWSWEEMMNTEKEETSEGGLLTKDFLKHVKCDGNCGCTPETCTCSKYDVETDPEFAALDNSVEPAIEIEKVSDDDFFAVNDLEENIKAMNTVNNTAEFEELMSLCAEIGIITLKDLESFKAENVGPGENLLDKLREFRASLGSDFKIAEAVEMTADELKNKFGTDDVDLINAGREEEDRVSNRKPLPEDMTIEALVEMMEENEDMVECKWCNDLFPKDECRKEVDFGYLCSRCEAAIKSRGETLTFTEGEDLDFFNEDFEDPIEDSEESESLFDEAESMEEVVDLLVKDEEEAITGYEEAEAKIEELVDAADIDTVKEVLDHIKEEEIEHIEELESILAEPEEKLEEVYNPNDYVDLEYDDIEITVFGNRRDVDDWDEADITIDWTYEVSKDDVIETLYNEYIVDGDVPGGIETLDDKATYDKFFEEHFDSLFEKYYDNLLDYYRGAATSEAEDNYSWENYESDSEPDYDDYDD